MLDLPPTPVNSHIWRFSSGFLIENVFILVATVTWWGGVDPKYMLGCLFPAGIPKSPLGMTYLPEINSKFALEK